jgi:hypothetical protein
MLIGQAAHATCSTPECPSPNIATVKALASQVHQAAKPRTTSTAPINYAQILSVFNANFYNTLLIPQLAVPNASGAFDFYTVVLQLTSINPVQFQILEIQPVANPVNAMSAAFSPEAQLLFIPVMAADLGNNNPIAIFETMLKVTSLQPFTLTEYLPMQTTQPSSPQASPVMSDPTSYQMLSQMSSMMHNTNMSIIANMDGTSCYGYSYQCD